MEDQVEYRKQVNITPDPGTSELIIRHGEAPKVKDVKRVLVEGSIYAPLYWLQSRKDLPSFNPKQSHVLVDQEKGQISLIINEHSEDRDIIAGIISTTKTIEEMSLISLKYRSPEEAALFLRLRRHYFYSDAEYSDLYVKLRGDFKAKISQEVEKAKDDRGNFVSKVNQVVKHTIPETFKMILPVFKGTIRMEIEIEILINDSLDVAFFSSDLIQKMDQYKKDTIDEVAQDIKDLVPELLIIRI
jgi:hypothetical protein